MAVYTTISAAQLNALCARLGLTLQGIPTEVSDGIENTTYFFSAVSAQGERREYVLTILENTPVEQMRFSAQLCIHFALRGLPVPAPLVSAAGEFCFDIAGKNALVFPKAIGAHPPEITVDHCAAMGTFLATAHVTGKTFSQRLETGRGLVWMEAGRLALETALTNQDKALLDNQLGSYRQLSNAPVQLPKGPIHGDLFTDNTLFDGPRLTGVIDFYNACTDWLLIDVAIAVNDWCCKPGEAMLNNELTGAFLHSYHKVRPFTGLESEHWQAILCLAATRFWISRLIGVYRPELLGGNVRTKNPDAYRERLIQRLATVPPLPR